MQDFLSCANRDVILLLGRCIKDFFTRTSFYSINTATHAISHQDVEFSGLRLHFATFGSGLALCGQRDLLLSEMTRTINWLGIHYCQSICDDMHHGLVTASGLENLDLIEYYINLGCHDLVSSVLAAAENACIRSVILLYQKFNSHMIQKQTHDLNCSLLKIAINNNDSALFDFCGGLDYHENSIFIIIACMPTSTEGWSRFIRSSLFSTMINLHNNNLPWLRLTLITICHQDQESIDLMARAHLAYPNRYLEDYQTIYQKILNLGNVDLTNMFVKLRPSLLRHYMPYIEIVHGSKTLHRIIRSFFKNPETIRDAFIVLSDVIYSYNKLIRQYVYRQLLNRVREEVKSNTGSDTESDDKSQRIDYSELMSIFTLLIFQECSLDELKEFSSLGFTTRFNHLCNGQRSIEALITRADHDILDYFLQLNQQRFDYFAANRYSLTEKILEQGRMNIN